MLAERSGMLQTLGIVWIVLFKNLSCLTALRFEIAFQICLNVVEHAAGMHETLWLYANRVCVVTNPCDCREKSGSHLQWSMIVFTPASCAAQILVIVITLAKSNAPNHGDCPRTVTIVTREHV